MEWCPQCQRLQPTDTTESIREEMTADNELIKILSKSYCCASCRLFIRSEETRQKVSRAD